MAFAFGEPATAIVVEATYENGVLKPDRPLPLGEHGLTHLASHDADFDRVPGLTRYAPA